ncbi:unnamed protein product [Cuscuta epithymum]|uniref:Uncharacterized protein n=1 Tax=Cuscuta epithymum TaxID=186058 RepID=A0AAV0CDI3_9ASTE|nr:unnamed protein product [Cuscuta epithymum]
MEEIWTPEMEARMDKLELEMKTAMADFVTTMKEQIQSNIEASIAAMMEQVPSRRNSRPQQHHHSRSSRCPVSNSSQMRTKSPVASQMRTSTSQLFPSQVVSPSASRTSALSSAQTVSHVEVPKSQSTTSSLSVVLSSQDSSESPAASQRSSSSSLLLFHQSSSQKASNSSQRACEIKSHSVLAYSSSSQIDSHSDSPGLQKESVNLLQPSYVDRSVSRARANAKKLNEDNDENQEKWPADSLTWQASQLTFEFINQPRPISEDRFIEDEERQEEKSYVVTQASSAIEYELTEDSNTTVTVQVDGHQATSNTDVINGLNSKEGDAVLHRVIENGLSSDIIHEATTVHRSVLDIAIYQKEAPLGNILRTISLDLGAWTTCIKNIAEVNIMKKYADLEKSIASRDKVVEVLGIPNQQLDRYFEDSKVLVGRRPLSQWQTDEEKESAAVYARSGTTIDARMVAKNARGRTPVYILLLNGGVGFENMVHILTNRRGMEKSVAYTDNQDQAIVFEGVVLFWDAFARQLGKNDLKRSAIEESVFIRLNVKSGTTVKGFSLILSAMWDSSNAELRWTDELGLKYHLGRIRVDLDPNIQAAVNGLEAEAKCQPYKMVLCSNDLEENFSSGVLLMETKPGEDVGIMKVEPYLQGRIVMASFSILGLIKLDAEPVREAKRFQEFSSNGLFGKLFTRASDLKEKGAELSLAPGIVKGADNDELHGFCNLGVMYLNVLEDIFVGPKGIVKEVFQPTILEVLKRSTDRTAEVWMGVLVKVKAGLLCDSFSDETPQILSILEKILRNYEGDLGNQVAAVLYDVAAEITTRAAGFYLAEPLYDEIGYKGEVSSVIPGSSYMQFPLLFALKDVKMKSQAMKFRGKQAGRYWEGRGARIKSKRKIMADSYHPP